MIQKRTIQVFFQRAILRYAVLGIFFLFIIAATISFLLVRDQMTADLQESARSISLAFRDRIIDGDIRSVEPQIRQVLQLHEGESVQILKSDFSRFYETAAGIQRVQACPDIGKSCYASYFGQARILYPIALDNEGKVPFRFLYISRDVHLNWPFLIITFTVFILGFLSLIIAFLQISKLVSSRLSIEIAGWSDRLRENPKDVAPLLRPPFTELLPLKEAIEGLNVKIENYEKAASHTAQLLILRGIAHDLLTPVARLQLYIATLGASIDREQNAEVLADIQDSLNRVIGVASQVKALKELERIDAGADLVAVTAEEVRSLRDSAEVAGKFISLEFLSTNESIAAPFTQTEISRIVFNLVKNAAESSSMGSTIKVEVGTDQNSAFLSVEDFGCGIPENSLSRVFDPDFTMKPATGTGLGLSIVKYICDQRSAKIHLKSETRRGTTVTIRVPAPLGRNHV